MTNRDGQSDDWKAIRLIDERTGNSCIGFHFPTWQHGPRFEVIDEDLSEQPGKVRARLKRRGAAFNRSKVRFSVPLLLVASYRQP